MALRTWPSNVRGNDGRVYKDGYVETAPDNILRSEMDDGHKSRRKFTRGWSTVSFRLRLPLAEYEIFRHNFVHLDLKDGVLPFRFNHPLRDYDVAAKFLPQNDGQAFTHSPAPGANVFVNIQLEFLDRAVT